MYGFERDIEEDEASLGGLYKAEMENVLERKVNGPSALKFLFNRYLVFIWSLG
jgi:hypothetical protein